MSERVLYLPSTAFNLFVSLLDIQQRRPKQVQLIMIDQCKPVEYLSVLKTCSELPLHTLELLPAAQGFFKPLQRRRHFRKLWDWVGDFKPDEIVVGSDRRIEFQYLMHRFRRSGHDVKGVYLDDGLFSYLEWPKKPLQRYLDNLFKKLAYGSWWHAPEQIGDSQWVDEVRLFAPEFARPSLKARKVELILGSTIHDKTINEISRRIMKKMGVDVPMLFKAEKVILIPHPHNLDGLSGFSRQVLDEFYSSDNPVLVKYHPRFKGEDVLGLGGKGGYLLPDNVAFEFFLPLLNKQAEVIGDLTTALLSTCWMRPDLKVYALGQLDGRFDNDLLRIYKSFGVRMRHA